SGSVVICKDKSSFDYEAAKSKIEEGLARNQFYLSREWPYKNVKPRIIIEKYLVDEATGDLPDYKFFCFDGEPKYIQVCSERFSETGLKINNYDMDSNELPFNETERLSNRSIKKLSVFFPQMKEYSEILSAGFPHVRVDFVVTENSFYFTELTFFDSGGRHLYEPDEYNYIIGEWITLPPKMRNK
ncbi:MAG: glycosyl transferase, partial [Clostridia bacterium]|nr:glycosyl transferase [Clostridia bacterium]